MAPTALTRSRAPVALKRARAQTSLFVARYAVSGRPIPPAAPVTRIFCPDSIPGPSSPPDRSALRLVFGQSGLGPGQVIVAGPVRSRGQVDVVDARRVDPQDLLLDGRRQLGIAVPLPKGRGYVERPE